MRTVTLEPPSEDLGHHWQPLGSLGGSAHDVWQEAPKAERFTGGLVLPKEWQNHSPTEAFLAEAFECHSLTKGKVVRLSLVRDGMQQFKRLSETLESIAKRQPNWDGNDGLAPSADALTEARAFLTFLKGRGGLPQNLYSPGDGEINFEWRASRRFTEVGFNGDRTISWFHRDAHGELFGDEDFNPNNIRENSSLLQVLGISDALSE
ncbi:hypothetical protein [Shinella sp.]|uniref:hypothetical protein n=1 Tax=Shinella sp. TaxID=1870904 RepID=UPI0029A857CD|nr:hypothetical protein [Shinella sp.]MDX3977025.1 hypothetical protein [Shinella sp.]